MRPLRTAAIAAALRLPNQEIVTKKMLQLVNRVKKRTKMKMTQNPRPMKVAILTLQMMTAQAMRNLKRKKTKRMASFVIGRRWMKMTEWKNGRIKK